MTAWPSELLTGVGNTVEGGHDKARAVADDAHRAVELDVVEPLGLGRRLERIGRSLVLQGRVPRMTEAGVLVEGDLAVQGDDPAIGGLDQRVDLDQCRVLVPVNRPQLLDGVSDLLLDVLIEVRRVHDLLGLGRVDAHDRVDGDTGKGLRTLHGQHLDLHPALLASHRQIGTVGPIEQNGEVVLLLDLRAGGDHHLVDGVTLDVHAQNVGSRLSCLIGGPGDLDATSLATPADLDLSLDDDHSAAAGADHLCRCSGFFNRLGHDSSQHRYTVRFEHVARLILEKIHEAILIVAYGNSHRIVNGGYTGDFNGVP